MESNEQRLWWVEVIIVESCLKFNRAAPKNTSIRVE